MSEDALVFWILGIVFLAVGAHLILHGRRRSAMLRHFASRHGLSYEARPPNALDDELTQTFRIEEEGYARAFMLVRDVVSDGRVRLFRCTELLDLNPWGESQGHRGRVAALFPVDPRHEHRSMYDVGGRPLEPAPFNAPSADPAVTREIEAVLAGLPPRHVLSLTLARGHGLIYVEPMLVGSEKEPEQEYLFELGRRLADALRVSERAEHRS